MLNIFAPLHCCSSVIAALFTRNFYTNTTKLHYRLSYSGLAVLFIFTCILIFYERLPVLLK